MLGGNGSSASGEMVYKIDLFTIIECTPIGEEFERILVD